MVPQIPSIPSKSTDLNTSTPQENCLWLMDMVTVVTEGDILDSAAEDTIDAILPTDVIGDITNAL
jgi:hypothetical protein